MKNELTFRYAERKDTGLILQFIKELADYKNYCMRLLRMKQHWKNGFLINRRQRSFLAF